MAFRFCESMCHQYWSLGYVVFRRILPASLLRDLRPEADKIRAIAREVGGPNAQRLQPIIRWRDRFNYKPFQDYVDLPELRDALQRLLGPAAPGCNFVHSQPGQEYLGVLTEPTRPRVHGWHRDGDGKLAADMTPDQIAEIAAVRLRPTCDNQVNCAIYPDPCLWYVPGSHLRVHDLPGERPTWLHQKRNDLEPPGASDAEIERAGLEECANFPGAVRLYLDAGDFAAYRSSGWHNGLYSPLQPRATIHDVITYWRKDR